MAILLRQGCCGGRFEPEEVCLALRLNAIRIVNTNGLSSSVFDNGKTLRSSALIHSSYGPDCLA
jgi:hypothetical protein